MVGRIAQLLVARFRGGFGPWSPSVTVPRAAPGGRSGAAAPLASGRGETRVIGLASRTALRVGGSAPVRLQDAAGSCVQVLDGTVWITQQFDSRDVVLERGESLLLDRDGTTIVQPLGEATLLLRPASAHARR